MRHIFYLLLSLVSLIGLSCSGGGDSMVTPPDSMDVLPANLVVNVSVSGVNGNNPYGDGSGVVNITASATNAVSYGFIIDGNSEQTSANGALQHIFNNVEGVQNHEIKVLAYSSTNHSINTVKTAAVSFYNGTPPFWADEFFENGAPKSSNWTYDIGAGGWGNNEAQTYTNNASNVVVENGILKIIAKSNGSNSYTSARLKSQGLFKFTYGRIDVRAKLPVKAGTWPAIWMLGSNFTTVSWPRCGEIDIMEQTGADKSKVLATCHWFNTSNSTTASYGLNTSVSNASSVFHVYSAEWTTSSIKMFVDNVKYYEIDLNGISDSPFNKDFFVILNVAMGGSLGGNIDSTFTEDRMEVDYVRVYK